jgi:hypothetical protein
VLSETFSLIHSLRQLQWYELWQQGQNGWDKSCWIWQWFRSMKYFTSSLMFYAF